MIVATAFMFGGAIGYVLHDQIIALLKRPYDATLYYGSPAGSFNFIMKICMLSGIIVAVPVFVYNVISFIQPAFKQEVMRKSIRRTTVLSMILAAAGISFAFFIIVPMSLHFFGGFKVAGIDPLITADSYLSFIINCLLSFTVIFQIPLIITFIDHIRPIPPGKMFHNEKYVIVGALALALVLPFTYDPLTQFVVAIPIIVLYNISILLVLLSHRKRRRLAAKTTRAIPTSIRKVPAFQPVRPTPQPQRAAPMPLPVAAFKPVNTGLIQDIVSRPKQKLIQI